MASQKTRGCGQRESDRAAGLRSALLGTVLLGLGIPAAALAQAPAPTVTSGPVAVSFSIASQSLDTALTTFADQAGLKLLFASQDVRGLTSQGLSGRFTPGDALGRLLAGTGLDYRFTDARTVTLMKALTGATNGAMALPPLQVQGQASTADAQDSRGPGVGYVATRSRTATKSDTPLIEIPQTISTVTRQQMDDQNAQSVRQALRYTSGVVPERNGLNGDAYEQIYGRGFVMEEYLDGLRLPTNAYNILAVDPYDLARVEVLHGPASVLYGQANPGGMVNLVSKLPTDTPQHEVFLQGGRPGQVGGGVDLSGPLDPGGQLTYRLVGSAKSADTQVDHIKQERVNLAPSLTWRPDTDTSFTILGRYQYDPQAGYYNNLPALGTIDPTVYGRIPTKLDPGDPSYEKYNRTEESIGYLFDHRFNDVWSVHQSLRYTHDNAAMENVFGLALESDQQTLDRYAFANYTSLDQFDVDTNTQVKFGTGPLRHMVTAGVDYQRISFKERYGSNFDEPSLDIFAPVYNQFIAPPTSYSIDTQIQNQVGLYAQDQIRLGRWSFLLGGRQDWLGGSVHDEVANTRTSLSDGKFTWRAGLVYLFDNGLAPYFSYSTSFYPSTGTDYAGSAFKPTTGEQYEIGVKYQPTGFNSFITVSAFSLTQQNVLTTDSLHPQFETQTGEIRSRGIELEGHASLANNLDLVLAYAYLDNVVTKSNTTAGAYTDNVGKTPSGIPSQMASAWVNYEVPWYPVAGLRLGGGVRYVGGTYGDNADSFKVPSVTLFDAAVHYDLGQANDRFKGWQAEVNATNLFDKTYVAGCTSSTVCYYGLRRTVLGSLNFRW